MTRRKPKLDLEMLEYFLSTGDLNGASMLLTVYGENCRKKADGISKAKVVKDAIENVMKACLDADQLDNFILIYQATHYVPHGSIIQPVFDKVLRTFLPLVKAGELPQYQKEILWKYIELSLEAYDKMHSFRVFLHEFRVYMPFNLVPKALDIAKKLGDNAMLEEIRQNLMQPPKELDRSPSNQD